MKISKVMCCLGVSLILCACKRVEEIDPYEPRNVITPQITYQALRTETVTTVAETIESLESEEIEAVEVIEYGVLPDCPTNMYLLMDYRTITDTTTDQWALQHDSKISTNEDGFRVYDNEYYVVALAENYGTEIGQTWEVVLDNGSVFKIIHGECKSAKDLNYTPFGHSCINYDEEYCINVIEFVIDENIMPIHIQRLGTVSGFDKFNGNIVEMRATGKIW